MAQLKVDPRKIAQPSAPPGGEIAQGLSALGVSIQNATGELVKYEVDRLKTEKSMALTTGAIHQQRLYNDVVEDPNLSTNSLPLFQERVDASIGSVLEQTPKQYQKEVEQTLLFQAETHYTDLLSAVRKKTITDNKNALIGALEENKGLYAEQVGEGNYELASLTKQSINDQIFSLRELGVSDAQLKLEARAIEQGATTAMYVGQFIRAEQEGKGAEFLSSFAKKKPEGMTNTEYLEVGGKLREQKNRMNAQRSELDAEFFQETKNSIDTGAITNIDDLRARATAVDMSTLDYLRLENHLQRTLASSGNKATEYARAEEAIRRDDGSINDFSKKTINELFDQKVDNARDMMRQNEGLEDYEPSLLDMGTIVAKQMHTDVPHFTNRMNHALTMGSPEIGIEALGAYRELKKLAPYAIDSLGTQEKQIAAGANFDIEYGASSLGAMADALERNRALVLDPKAPELEVRRRLFQDTYNGKNGEKKRNNAFKEIFGKKYKPGVSDTAKGVAIASLYKNYELFGDDKALAVTQDELAPRWGASAYSEKDAVVLMPMEKQPEYNASPIVADNQLAIALDAVVRGNKEAKKLGYAYDEIRFPPGKELPNTINQRGLYEKSYLPVKGLIFDDNNPTMVINGKDRKVYLQTTVSSRTDGDGGVKYFMYYKDDAGRLNFLLSPSGDGQASFTLKSPDKFAPEGLKSLLQEKITARKEKVLGDTPTLNVMKSLRKKFPKMSEDELLRMTDERITTLEQLEGLNEQ